MSKRKILVTTVSVLVAMTVVAVFLPNPTGLASDLVRNLTTHTPESIETLVQNLRLTNRGKFIFGAVNPQLESAETFNQSCTTNSESTSSLGCYESSTQRIHIYLVESDELSGEVEATAAHELLHAAWDRLSVFERSRIEPLLLEVYNSPAHHEDLAKSLKNYTPSELATELHSQIGERIKDLPAELERHYAKYFEDQDLIVSYFEAYSSVFDKLVAESEVLLQEIEASRAALELQATEYSTWLDNYNERVQEFNACARNPSCPMPNFESRRNALVAESQRLDDAYEAYEAARIALNARIDTYNSGVQHLKKLDYALDSRASPPEEESITNQED